MWGGKKDNEISEYEVPKLWFGFKSRYGFKRMHL